MSSYKDILTIDIAKRLGLDEGKKSSQKDQDFYCFNHNDKNPSLKISKSNRGFKCFSCGISGNNVELVKRVLNLDTNEAIQWIKEKFGIEDDYIKPQQSSYSKKLSKVKTTKKADSPKLQIRFINKNSSHRFEHVEKNELLLKNPTNEDIQNIKSILGKSYTLETLNKAAIKINHSKIKHGDKSYSGYGMVFPSGQIKYNPGNLNKWLHVEGRTDYLTAIELELEKHFGIISDFNKTSKVEIVDRNHLFILDEDVKEEDLRNRIIAKQAVKIKIIRLPKQNKDLSDYYNDGRCSLQSILDLITNAHEITIGNDKNDITKILEESNNSIKIYPAQDFKDGKLWYSCETSKGLLVVNSRQEHYLKDDLEENNIKCISNPSKFLFKPATIAQFLNNTNDLKTNYQNKKFLALELYLDLKNYLEKYFYFVYKSQSSVLAVWLMGTYIFAIFRYYPYLHFQAEKRSGKSLLMEIMSYVSFNPFIGTNVSVSSLFREIECNRTVMFLDEVESLRSSDKEIYSSLMQILNSGFKYDGKVMRTVGSNNNLKPQEFSTYGPKCFAGIDSIDDVLQDRTIKIKILRKKVDEKIDRFKISQELEKHTDNLKQKGFIFGLTYAEDIHEFMSSIESIPEIPDVLTDRELDIWESLFSIARVIQYEADSKGLELDLIDQMQDSAKSSHEARMEDDDERNTTTRLVKMISEMIEEKIIQTVYETDNGEFYSRNQIYQAFQKKYRGEFPHIDTRIKLVQQINKKLGLKCPQKGHLGNNDKDYFFPKGFLQDLQERFLAKSGKVG
jgi:hypothetical protein